MEELNNFKKNGIVYGVSYIRGDNDEFIEFFAYSFAELLQLLCKINLNYYDNRMYKPKDINDIKIRLL